MAVNPTSAFQFNGVVSGLNTNSIIQAMMSENQRDSAYQAIQTQVQSFQTALQTLLTPSSVAGKLVSSSTSSVASATADTTAINGSLTLNISRLATATTVTSANPISQGVNPTATLASAGFA